MSAQPAISPVRSRLTRAAAALALVVLAAACGSSESSDEPGAVPPTEEPAPASDPAAPRPTLAGLSLVDDSTFTVSLVAPDPEFPLRVSYTGFAPLPSVFFDDPVGFEEAPVGNGPFRIEGTWEHDARIRVVPFDDYAGPVAPTVSSVTFNIYEDAVVTAYLDAQAGIVDVAEAIPSDAAATAPEEFGERYAESAGTTIYYYGFPTYLDERFTLDMRRALSMAVDRDLISQVIFDGTTIPAHSAFPDSLAGSRDHVCDNWDHDPEGAQAAFAAAGGVDALGDEPIVMWFDTSETHAQIAEAISNQWRAVLGIDNFEFRNLEFSEYLPLLDAQEVTGPFRLGWGADYLSPLNFLEPLYASYSTPPTSVNLTFYNSTEFDEAISEGKAAFATFGDLNQAIPFYQAAEDDVCENVTIMPIHFIKNTYVWSDNVGNVFKDALGNMNWVEMTGDDIVGAITEPEHLAPPLSNETGGIEVLEVLFSQLVEYDHRTSEPHNVVAESITTEDAGKTWTITVADGWTFHNGEPVTARSFVDAWSWASDPANTAANSGLFAIIEGWDELNA